MANLLSRRISIFVLAAGLAMPAGARADEPPKLERVQRDVMRLSQAIGRGDVDTVLELTHPRIIELMGGYEAARVTTRQGLQRTLAMGIKIESLSFPQPPEFLEGGGRRFAIVPTLTIASANGQRVESLNFQLGVLDAGSKAWKYVEGSRVNEQNVQSLFLGFPGDYKFPSFYRKRL